MSDFKLKFELVPDGCWYSNLRSILKPKAWDILRKDAYARAGGKCMVCGRKATRLEAHERWSYDEENKVQKLEDQKGARVEDAKLVQQKLRLYTDVKLCAGDILRAKV